MAKFYWRFDHRLRNLVAQSGDVDRFVRLGIPISTLLGWLKDGPVEVFTIPELTLATNRFVQQNLALKSKINAANAQHALVLATVRIFGSVFP